MTNKVPNIRFKGFTDDWEQRKLGEVVSLRGRIGFRGYKESDLVAPGDGAITFSPADIDEMGNVSTENNKYLSWMKYDESPEIQVDVGDILFTKTASIGKIGYIKDLKEKATINPQFALLTPKENSNGYFTFLSVRSDSFMKQVRGITGGSSVPTMSQEKLKELVFMSPSLGEQQKIGEYFSNLDHLITLHQRKCEQTKELKKYMLQKMFPKKGEKNPEIRFPGFTDDWEQRKFGEMFARRMERNNGEFDNTKWISVARMYYQTPDKVTSNNIDTRTYVMRKGDIAFEGHSNSEFKYGRFVANDIGDGVISELFPIYKHIDKYDLNYWKYAIQLESLMQSKLVKCIEISYTSSNKLDKDSFLKEKIPVASLAEQEKIGGYFSNLDRLITLHQRKCEQLKELKKFMLQNMFPKKG